MQNTANGTRVGANAGPTVDSTPEPRSSSVITFDSAALPSVASSYRLSKREVEVLHWVMEAKSDSEIATILSISHRTVNHHVGSILRKIGVENRVAACRIAWEAQLKSGTES
ncbi:MAG: helix-turn-helix transcriptional regulator [Verrucomicrobiota bacterium]